MARAHDANHRAMREAIGEMDGSSGYDAVIVCTSNAAQEAYWQTRLEATRGQAAKNGATIVCVHEDWAADGAGNGLGTLCLLYTSPSPRDATLSRMPSSA